MGTLLRFSASFVCEGKGRLEGSDIVFVLRGPGYFPREVALRSNKTNNACRPQQKTGWGCPVIVSVLAF